MRFGLGQATVPEAADFIEKHEKSMKLAHQLARNNLQESQHRQKKGYDVKLYQCVYSVGDVVQQSYHRGRK